MKTKQMNVAEKEIEDLRKKLEQKVHLTTSQDGVVSRQYTGTGDYKNISINVDLKTIDKDVLEKDILDLITYSKNQMQADLTEAMLALTENESSQAEEDDYYEEVRDVS